MCATNPPIFRYAFYDGDEKEQAEYMKGFCCASCASKLLEVLEQVECKEWAWEQAALEADEVGHFFIERHAGDRLALVGDRGEDRL